MTKILSEYGRENGQSSEVVEFATPYDVAKDGTWTPVTPDAASGQMTINNPSAFGALVGGVPYALVLVPAE